MDTTSVPAAPPPASRSRRRWGVASLGFALLLAAGAGYWAYTRQGRPHFVSAQQALARHDLADAADHLGRHLQSHPRDADALLLAGRTARRLGRADDAERLLTSYQSLAGVTDSSRLEWDLLRVQRGDGGDVEARLKQTVPPGHPDAPFVLEALARGYLSRGRLMDAVAACDLWAKVQPDHPWPWAWRGDVYERLGNFHQALADYKRAAEIVPDDREVTLSLAALYVRGRRPADAVPHYRAVLARSPDDREALLGLAGCRIESGEAEEAVRSLDRVLAADPESQRALFLRGKAALELQDAAGAERWLTKAVAQASDDHEALHRLILSLRAQSKNAEADRLAPKLEAVRKDVTLLDDLTRAVARTPDDARTRHRAGVVALRLGRDADGVRWLLGALQADGDHAATHAALAEHFAKVGDPRAGHHRRLAPRAGP